MGQDVAVTRDRVAANGETYHETIMETRPLNCDFCTRPYTCPKTPPSSQGYRCLFLFLPGPALCCMYLGGEGQCGFWGCVLGGWAFVVFAMNFAFPVYVIAGLIQGDYTLAIMGIVGSCLLYAAGVIIYCKTSNTPPSARVQAANTEATDLRQVKNPNK